MAVLTRNDGGDACSRTVSGVAACVGTMLLAALGCSSDPGDRSGTPTPSTGAATSGQPSSPAQSSTGVGPTAGTLDSPLAVARGPSSSDPVTGAPVTLHVGEECVTVRVLGQRQLLAFNKGYARWDANRGVIRFESIGDGDTSPITLRDGERVTLQYQGRLRIPVSAWVIPPDRSCPRDVVLAFAINPLM